METTEKVSRWKIFLTGLIGFLIAAGVGVLAGFVFFRLGIYQFLIHLVPQNQPLVRLLTALLLSFAGVGLAGAAYGLMTGLTLHQIDPEGSRRRYLLGGAFAYGISYAILFIPILLLIALIGQYNQGSSKDPSSFILLFGLIGLLYGLLSGLVLALVTVKVRYSWLPFLTSILSGTLGGIFLGIVLWRHNFFLNESTLQFQLIAFFLYFALAFAGLIGGFLALAYTWVKGRRTTSVDRKVEPRRAQDLVIITSGGLLFILVFNLTNTLINFVTIHTGTTTTSVASETQGVGWSAPSQLTVSEAPSTGSAPDLKADPAGRLSAVWSFNQDGNIQIAYASQESGDYSDPSIWSSPVNVSNNPNAQSIHPQLAIGPDSKAHIVWSEQTNPEKWDIYYSDCIGKTCKTPKAISMSGAESCASSPQKQDWPAIAAGQDGSLAISWNADGLIAYAISTSGQPFGTTTCITPTPGANPDLQPRIAAGDNGQFSIVYGTGNLKASAAINMLTIGPDGTGAESEIGQGRLPEIYHSPEGQIHLAWCNADGLLNYSTDSSADTPVETVSSPPCMSRPNILQDTQGKMHLIWFSDQIQDNFGKQQSGNYLYESIRTESGWSRPAIFAQLAQSAAPSSVSLPTGGLSALWMDTAKLYQANQPLYQCTVDSLNVPGKAVLDVVQSGDFHPTGYQSPFCDNQFKSFIYMPEPNPAFSSLPVTPNGGFDLLRGYIQAARYELLISNMQWDPDQDELSPGYQIVEGVADLYKKIEANPSDYPRGLTVRILLGNYPNLATFQYGDQIWNVIDDLRAAGVEKMEDPAVGWKLEVANFRGSYPHSHTKFIVIDGKQLMAAGFNVSWLHYPADHPSGKGDSLVDLGMAMEGPVAQPGMADFDDEWNGSHQLVCSDLAIGEKADTWKHSCEWKTGTVSHVPEILKYMPTDEGSTAFALYRTDVYKEADHAYDAALASAQESIDAIHVNFSAQIQCLLNLIAPDTCTFDENALSWMKAIVQAVEKNHAKVRVIVENANSNGLENRVGVEMLEQKLASLGLSNMVEVRFFNGRVHMKTALVDQQLLFVGSQNFHYSSFSPGGLLEFVGVTDSKTAIEEYQKMFDYYWQQSIPADEAVWGTTG